GIRTKGDLARAQGSSDIEVKQRKQIEELLAARAGKAAKLGAPTKPRTAKQQLDDYTAEEKLRLMKEGKMNLAGEMLDDKGNVIPKTKAEAPEAKLEPFADTEYENEALFGETAGTAGNYQKNRQADADMVAAVNGFKTMERLLKESG